MPSWRPTIDDLARVIAQQNPWRSDGHVDQVLARPKERALAEQLHKVISQPGRPRFQLVLGPRRVGKTTVMYQTVKHLIDSGVAPWRCLWLRLDHPILMETSLDQFMTAIVNGLPAGEEAFVFLDELVYADNWDLWLKTFYDDHWPVRIVATSSATAALRGRRRESGVGRWDEQYLAPYLFSEYLELVEARVDLDLGASLAETIRALAGVHVDLAAMAKHRRRLMLVGGFPELIVGAADVSVDDERAMLLRSQEVLRTDAVERAIYKDIPQSFNIDRPMLLERLCYVLAGQVAGVLQPAALCQSLDGLSVATFERYLSYLEDTFIVFTLPNYSGHESNVQRRGRKCYFVDAAVRNAALQRGLVPLDDPNELGVLTENLVAANLHALAQQTGVRLYHWRDGRHQVDLLYDHPDGPLALEIGLSADHPRASLVELTRRYPQFAGSSWLAAPHAPYVEPEHSPSGIGSIPLDLLLVAAGRQAERSLATRLSVPGSA